MVQGSTFQNIKDHAEEFIYNNLNKTKKIRIETENEQAYVCTTDEFKEDGWNAFLKKPVMAKQASIEEVNGVKVLVNPSWNEMANIARKLSGGHMFRGLIDPHTGDLFVWDAFAAVHLDMIPDLGLDIKYSEESPYCLYFNPTPLSITDALQRQQEVKQGKIPRASSLNKQAAVDIEHTKDWLLRHKTPMDAEGRAILYHGTPKANAEVLRANGLRQWSLLAQTPEEAIHYAGRDRDLKPKNITVFEVHVPVDKLNGGVFASVAEALGPEYLKEIKIGKQAGSNNNSYWIDPKGEVYLVPETTHDIWMVNESQMLKDKYGIDTTKEDWRNLIERGWTRVNTSEDSASLEVANIHNMPLFLKNFIKEYVGETPKSIYRR